MRWRSCFSKNNKVRKICLENFRSYAASWKRKLIAAMSPAKAAVRVSTKQTDAKQARRPNAPRQKNGRFKSQCSPSTEQTLTALPTITTTNKYNAILTMTFYTSPFEKLLLYKNLSYVIDTNSLFSTLSAVITIILIYVNVFPVI